MTPITFTVPADHPAFEGHFTGQPLLPGVALLAEVIEAMLADAELRSLVGPRPRIGIAKFVAPVLPGAVLSMAIRAQGGRAHFELHQGGRLAATGHFESGAEAESR